MGQLQGAEMGLTTQTRSAISEARQAYAGLSEKWKALRNIESAALNQKLKTAGFAPIEIEEASR
jgi:hypothetical protein